MRARKGAQPLVLRKILKNGVIIRTRANILKSKLTKCAHICYYCSVEYFEHKGGNYVR